MLYWQQNFYLSLYSDAFQGMPLTSAGHCRGEVMLEPVLVLDNIRGRLPSYACVEKVRHLSNRNVSLHMCPTHALSAWRHWQPSHAGPKAVQPQVLRVGQINLGRSTCVVL